MHDNHKLRYCLRRRREVATTAAPIRLRLHDLSREGSSPYWYELYTFQPSHGSARYKYYISGSNVVTDDYEVAADKVATADAEAY